MFGDLIGQGIELRDRLVNFAQASDPFAKSLTVVTELGQIEIAPTPRIELVSVSPEAVEGINDLRGVVRKYDVSGISKLYSLDVLEKEGVTFLVDNQPCHLVPGTVKEGAIAWSLQLQVALVEQEDFYGSD